MWSLKTKRTTLHTALLFALSMVATSVGCGQNEAIFSGGIDRSKAHVASTGPGCDGTALNLDDPNVRDFQAENQSSRLTMSWNGSSGKNFVVYRCKKNAGCDNYSCSFHLVFQCVGNPSCIVSDENGVNRTSNVMIDEIYDDTRFLEVSDWPLASGESVLVQSY